MAVTRLAVTGIAKTGVAVTRNGDTGVNAGDSERGGKIHE